MHFYFICFCAVRKHDECFTMSAARLIRRHACAMWSRSCRAILHCCRKDRVDFPLCGPFLGTFWCTVQTMHIEVVPFCVLVHSIQSNIFCLTSAFYPLNQLGGCSRLHKGYSARPRHEAEHDCAGDATRVCDTSLVFFVLA